MRDQLPEGWVWTTLGKATQPMQRRVNPQDYPEMPYIGMENVEAHTMQLMGTVPARQMKSLADSFMAGDVLYGRLRPYLNKVLCPDFNGLCSTEFIVFRQVPHIYSKYLQYFLNSWEFVTFSNSLNAGDRPRVKFEQFADYPFPLPPLPEQERIVAKIEALFSQLDAGVAALRRIQAALKRYKASVLKAACEGRLVAQDPADEPAEALLRRLGKAPLVDDDLPPLPDGWCWDIMSNVCVKIQDGTHFSPQVQYEEPIAGYYLYITAKNIKEHGIVLDDVTYIDEETHRENTTRCDPMKGDVLLIKDGVTTGTATVNQLDEEFTLLSSVALLRPNLKLLDPYFLKYYLNSPIGYKTITGEMTGTAIKRIILGKIKTSIIPLPPLSEQKRIVTEIERRLSVVAEVEAVVAALLARSARLRQAILKQAFEGKLV